MSNKKNHFPSQIQKNQNDPSITHIMNIRNLIETNSYKELAQYIKEEKIEPSHLDSCISLITQRFSKDNPYHPKLLEVLLKCGANVNTPIVCNNPPPISEKDHVSLLMFAIREKNVELAKLILKYHPELNMVDAKGRNAIIYSVIYEGNTDETEILSLLIAEKANINTTVRLEMEPKFYETHSVFTVACFQNSPRVVKLLLDNYVNANYRIMPSGDTGLHLAAFYGYNNVVSLLLNNKTVNTEIENNCKKRAVDLVKSRDSPTYHLFMNYYNNRLGGGMKDGSVNSSDIGENVDDEEKENNHIGQIAHNINNGYHNPIETGEGNIKINKFCFNNIKKNLSSSLAKKNNITPNLEIPIEFTRSNITNDLLVSFVDISSPPTLSFDLSDKKLELEMQVNELAVQLKEHLQVIAKFDGYMQDLDKTIGELTNELKRKEKDLNYRKAVEEENNLKIAELNKQKNELMSQLPKEKVGTQSNKSLSPKEYRELKFSQGMPDETFVTKTLQKDLLDYSIYIKDKIAKKKYIVDKLLENVQQAVNEITNEYEAVLYGSYATGLCLPWSDLDVVLVGKTQNSIAGPYLLNKLCFILKTKKWIQSFKIIDNTTIPIIKIVTSAEYEKMQIDISIQEEKHFGLKCVSLVKSYLSEYIVLEPLILALKTILKNANLNDPYSGGLSSYGLILMVVSYIQSKIDQKNYDEKEEDLIGKTFYGFLGHYGVYFDFNKYVILTYPIKDTNNSIADNDTPLEFGQNSHELIIVDPLNKKNNVAKSTHQFMNLKMAFMIAFMITREDCECGCHYGKAFHENTLTSTEHCILKRMFNSVKRFSENNK